MSASAANSRREARTETRETKGDLLTAKPHRKSFDSAGSRRFPAEVRWRRRGGFRGGRPRPMKEFARKQAPMQSKRLRIPAAAAALAALAALVFAELPCPQGRWRCAIQRHGQKPDAGVRIAA